MYDETPLKVAQRTGKAVVIAGAIADASVAAPGEVAATAPRWQVAQCSKDNAPSKLLQTQSRVAWLVQVDGRYFLLRTSVIHNLQILDRTTAECTAQALRWSRSQSNCSGLTLCSKPKGKGIYIFSDQSYRSRKHESEGLQTYDFFRTALYEEM